MLKNIPNKNITVDSSKQMDLFSGSEINLVQTWHNLYHSGGPFDFQNKAVFDVQLEKIINTAPEIIRQAAAATDIRLEQLIILYNASIMAGVVAPGAWLNYDNRKNFLTLYFLMIFPPASGKGIAAQVRNVLTKINTHLRNDYNTQLKEYHELEKKYKNSKTGTPPDKPKLKLVLAPGNTSSAKLIELLSDIDGQEILTMHESELDAIGISASSEFGSMNSTIFRQAFQFEPISKLIKKDCELQVAEIPKLSLILSGTLNQVKKLFHSNDDGLVSRFMILTGDQPQIWKDTRPCVDCPILDEHFEKLADNYFELWEFFKRKQIEIKFTEKQWDYLQKFGEYYLAKSHHFTGAESASIAKRHALMVCRLAAIFSTLRYHELNSKEKHIVCTDVDFGNALWLVEYSLLCSLDLFKKLPGAKYDISKTDRKVKFMEKLPESFTTAMALPIARELKISERSISRWLKAFVESGLLIHVEKGVYKKTAMAAMADLAVEDELSDL